VAETPAVVGGVGAGVKVGEGVDVGAGAKVGAGVNEAVGEGVGVGAGAKVGAGVNEAVGEGVGVGASATKLTLDGVEGIAVTQSVRFVAVRRSHLSEAFMDPANG